jgi:hypothetical protein
MIIYKTTNLIDGKIYIGQDTKNNPKYLGSGVLLKKAFVKYGKENFKKEILEECLQKNLLDEREKYWIMTLDSRNPKIGYNVAIGGEGQNLDIGKEFISKLHKGKKLSQETIEKIKKTMKNKPTSQSSINALLMYAGHRKGSKMSLESKRAISEANKGKTAWNKGLKGVLSDETINKMRKSKKGKKLSEEHKRKISEKSKNRKHSEETKKKLREFFLGKTINTETRKKISETLKNKTPKQKLESYKKFYISINGKEPTEEQLRLKLEEIKNNKNV